MDEYQQLAQPSRKFDFYKAAPLIGLLLGLGRGHVVNKRLVDMGIDLTRHQKIKRLLVDSGAGATLGWLPAVARDGLQGLGLSKESNMKCSYKGILAFINKKKLTKISGYRANIGTVTGGTIGAALGEGLFANYLQKRLLWNPTHNYVENHNVLLKELQALVDNNVKAGMVNSKEAFRLKDAIDASNNAFAKTIDRRALAARLATGGIGGLLGAALGKKLGKNAEQKFKNRITRNRIAASAGLGGLGGLVALSRTGKGKE